MRNRKSLSSQYHIYLSTAMRPSLSIPPTHTVKGLFMKWIWKLGTPSVVLTGSCGWTCLAICSKAQKMEFSDNEGQLSSYNLLSLHFNMRFRELMSFLLMLNKCDIRKPLKIFLDKNLTQLDCLGLQHVFDKSASKPPKTLGRPGGRSCGQRGGCRCRRSEGASFGQFCTALRQRPPRSADNCLHVLWPWSPCR